MFRTTVGAVDTGDDSGLAYLRPETAQGIFVNFDNVLDTMRRKLPFGIAQIGKAFRNEITPGNFTFRTREFEQMEIEYFVKPGDDEAAHQAWIDARTQWYVDLGMRPENLRQREQDKDELAHYAKRCVDLEYRVSHGLERARRHRQPHRLRSQARTAAARTTPTRSASCSYFDPGAEEAHRSRTSSSRRRAPIARRWRSCATPTTSRWSRSRPPRRSAKLRELVASFAKSVEKRDAKQIERRDEGAPAGRGREDRRRACPARCRDLLALSDDADANRIEVFKKVRGVSEKLGDEFTRTVLHLHPRLAPITVAVFPLKKNEPRLVEMARGIKKDAPGRRGADRLRRHGRHRQALPPPGRDRDAVLHHGRLPEPGGRHRDRPRPRHA